MRKLFKILLLTCGFLITANAQPKISPVPPKAVSNSVPTKWERYKVEERNVAVLFPKLPVKIGFSSVCQGEGTAQYAAYANDTIFVLRVTYEIKPFRNCLNKKEFSEKNFEARLAEIRASKDEKKELTSDKTNAEIYKFAGKTELLTLVNDFQNKRWFELRVIGDDLSKPEIGAFLESMKIESKPQGIEIGAGADKNLGDASESEKGVLPSAETMENKAETGVTQGVRLFFKPRANYTDAARTNNEQGVVRLRVTFLANGGIGAIETTDAILGYGLIEQAMAAAGKIVFLPARKNNVKYPVAKIVEYSFSLF